MQRSAGHSGAQQVEPRRHRLEVRSGELGEILRPVFHHPAAAAAVGAPVADAAGESSALLDSLAAGAGEADAVGSALEGHVAAERDAVVAGVLEEIVVQRARAGCACEDTLHALGGERVGPFEVEGFARR